MWRPILTMAAYIQAAYSLLIFMYAELVYSNQRHPVAALANLYSITLTIVSMII